MGWEKARFLDELPKPWCVYPSCWLSQAFCSSAFPILVVGTVCLHLYRKGKREKKKWKCSLYKEYYHLYLSANHYFSENARTGKEEIAEGWRLYLILLVLMIQLLSISHWFINFPKCFLSWKSISACLLCFKSTYQEKWYKSSFLPIWFLIKHTRSFWDIQIQICDWWQFSIIRATEMNLFCKKYSSSSYHNLIHEWEIQGEQVCPTYRQPWHQLVPKT